MDLLPGRKRCLAAPGGPCHLGAERRHSCSASSFLLETHVHGRSPVYRLDRSESAFVFSMTDGAYDTDKLIEFLTELRTHFAGEKLILIWDGLMAHGSKAMTAWLATQRHWLHVERVPVYAPELGSDRTGMGKHEIH
ncbi:transposase [Rhodococcus artemisiae]|uniref:Transposase n=1 Tax=Rhodococcus artemisiae TaxID=714159 RepID=A0ABU7LA31_9NOCA|nr:transposase [Rhodococcus artemisiae]MEE2058410.1 transposase [Rhodococcus artemisiae]